MAPRRPKRGETRMDAAIDAMSLMGFPEKLVRSTVNRLIKTVYGPEGWVFIEEGGYSELIELLLAEQKQADASAQDKEYNLGNRRGEASPSGCSNRTLLACSNTETSDGTLTTNQAIDTVSASSQTDNQLSIKAVDSVPATSETRNRLPIKSVDSASATSEIVDKLPIKIGATSSAAASEPGYQLPIIKAVDTVSANNESGYRLSVLDCRSAYSPPQTKAPQPVERLGRKRHRPCYGWISNDDDEEEEEEEEELIELPHAPLSQIMSMLVNDGVN